MLSGAKQVVSKPKTTQGSNEIRKPNVNASITHGTHLGRPWVDLTLNSNPLSVHDPSLQPTPGASSHIPRVLPPYIIDKKNERLRSIAASIFENPKAIHPIGSGCRLCNRVRVECVEGSEGICARCASYNYSADKCGVLGRDQQQPTADSPSKRPASVPESFDTTPIKRPRTTTDGDMEEGLARILDGLDNVKDAHTGPHKQIATAAAQTNGHDSVSQMALEQPVIESQPSQPDPHVSHVKEAPLHARLVEEAEVVKRSVDNLMAKAAEGLSLQTRDILEAIMALTKSTDRLIDQVLTDRANVLRN